MKRYCDDDEDPTRDRIGTVLRMTFPKTRANGDHRARRTLPMTMPEAIRFMDPFQAHARDPETHHQEE